MIRTGSSSITLTDVADGTPKYTWIKYSRLENPTLSTEISDSSDDMKYIGISYNNDSPVESTDPADYTWSSLNTVETLSILTRQVVSGSNIYYYTYFYRNGSIILSKTANKISGTYNGFSSPYMVSAFNYETNTPIFQNANLDKATLLNFLQTHPSLSKDVGNKVIVMIACIDQAVDSSDYYNELVELGFKGDILKSTDHAPFIFIGQVDAEEATGIHRYTGWRAENRIDITYTGSGLTIGPLDGISPTVQQDGANVVITDADGTEAILYGTSSNLDTVFPTTSAADVSGYLKAVTSVSDPSYDATAVDVPIPATGSLSSATNPTVVGNVITLAGEFTGVLANSHFTVKGSVRRSNNTAVDNGSKQQYASFYFELYRRDSSDVEHIIATSSKTPYIQAYARPAGGYQYEEFSAEALILDDTSWIESDRMVIRWYADTTYADVDKLAYEFQFGGETPLSAGVNVSSAVLSSLPDQSDNAGKILTTDGTNAEWSNVVDVDGLQTALDGKKKSVTYLDKSSPIDFFSLGPNIEYAGHIQALIGLEDALVERLAWYRNSTNTYVNNTTVDKNISENTIRSWFSEYLDYPNNSTLKTIPTQFSLTTYVADYDGDGFDGSYPDEIFGTLRVAESDLNYGRTSFLVEVSFDRNGNFTASLINSAATPYYVTCTKLAAPYPSGNSNYQVNTLTLVDYYGAKLTTYSSSSSGFDFNLRDKDGVVDQSKYLSVNYNKVWTAGNDGSGSGLDADTVDGIQGSNLARTSSTGSASDDINTFTTPGVFGVWASSNQPSGAKLAAQLLVTKSGQYINQTYLVEDEVYIRRSSDSGSTWSAWSEIWTSRTDGSGSGLDADTVDGLQASSFIRSDAADTMTGKLDNTFGIVSRSIDIGTTGNRTIQALANDNTLGSYGDLHIQHYGGNVHMCHGGGSAYVDDSKVFTDAYHPNADKLTTARTISLAGDASGSITFDGSANKTLTVTVQDDSHNHTIANVDGLQTALDGKLSTTGKAADSNLLDGLDSTRFMRRIHKRTATVGGGWMTVASNVSGRYHGEVIVTDADGGDHSFIRIDWMRSFSDSNFTVLNCGGYANRITGVRVLYQTSDDTYGTKYLQVYVTVNSNYEVNIYEHGDIDDYGVHSPVTPVIQNSISGYALHGSALTGLDAYGFAAEEGIRAGGHITTDGNFYIVEGSTTMGQFSAQDTTWTRINQDVAKNIYTPRMIRADGGFQVDGKTVVSSDGNTLYENSVALSSKYLGKTAKAADSDKLDGLDSSQFLRSDGKAVDADLLDGLQASSFLRSDEADTATGRITFNDGIVIPNTGSGIKFGPGTAGSDDAHIEWLGASNAGLLRFSTSDDNGTEYMQFGDYDLVNKGGTFTEWLKLSRTTFTRSGNTIWHAGNDGAGSGLDADTVDGIQASSFLRSNENDVATGQLTFSNKKQVFGSSTNWDTVGFSSQTNVHMQGHNQFWIGAGNGTWFTGAGNTKSQRSGLAADATYAHDLLLTTMQSDATYDRGITFATDNTGAGTSGWRLGKWHSGDAADSSKLVVDGGFFVKGGYTDEYDYYADDYSARYSAQGGEAHWIGDTGWQRPSLTASTAIQIQSGNAGTNTRNPELQFHQYGYGGVKFRYEGTADAMHLESTGADRFDKFRVKTDHGYIEIGPQNTSWAHIYTDRTAFYFNKDLYMLGSKVWHQGNDGAGGGLDADTVDGIHAASFLRSDTSNVFNCNGNALGFNFDDSDRNSIEFINNGTRVWHIRHGSTGQDLNFERAFGSGLFKVSGSTVWTTANDGAGSGLDADKLDGLQSSSFLRSDTDDSMNGDLTLTAALSYTQGTGVRVIQPQGGMYTTTTSSITGYLKITLPVSWTNTMLMFDIDIYDYAGDTDGESIKIRVGGYNYATNSSWSNVFANVVSGRTDRFFNVRFGHDGTKCAIYIGESGSTWSYPQVSVSNFVGGYSGATTASWADNWVVGFTTTLGTITKTKALENVASYSLDADKLDGLHSASFLRSDASDTFTGDLALGTNSSIKLPNDSDDGIRTSDNYRVMDSLDGTLRIGDTNKHSIIRLHGQGSDDFRVYYNSSDYNIWHQGNDGSGSGLDADTVDGLQASSFLRSDANDTATGAITFTSAALKLPGHYYHGFHSGAQNYIHLYSGVPGTEASTTDIRTWNGTTYEVFQLKGGDINGVKWRGNTIWHAGNDGSGSGLDADKLDGLDSGSFLRSDANDTFTNLTGTSLTIGSGATLAESTDRVDLLQITSNTSGWGGLQVRNSSNEGRWSFMTDGDNAGIYNDEDNQWAIYMSEIGATQLYFNGVTKLQTNSTGINITGNLSVDGTITETSDVRLKENIKTLDKSLDKVLSLRGVEYNKIGSDIKEIGFIAQEVHQVVPEIVSTDEEGMLSVSYNRTVALLVEAMKEQQAQIDALRAEISLLKK